ncbi:unnamed protein product [Auanema sp. JU1783]|nr:unnamed protein product [Auanema sp. JU1783]
MKLSEIEKVSADGEPPITGVFDDEAQITDSVSAAVTPICSDPEDEDPHVLPLKRAGDPILTASKRLKSSSLSHSEYMNPDSTNMLLSMGFSMEQIPVALALAEGDVEKAVLYLTGEVPGMDNDNCNRSVPENSQLSNGCAIREEYGGIQRMPLSALQMVQNYIYQGRALYYKVDNAVDKCLKAAIHMCQEDRNVIDEKLDDFIMNCLPEIVIRHSTANEELRFDSDLVENYNTCIDLSITLIVLSLPRPQCTSVVCRSMCEILNNEGKCHKYSKRREPTTHLKILLSSGVVYTESERFANSNNVPLYRLQESIEQFCQDGGFELLSKLIKNYPKSAESLENMLACIQLTNLLLPYMRKEWYVSPTANWMDKGLDTIETLAEKDIRSSYTRSCVLELLDELNRLSYNIPSTEHNGENGRLDITRLEFILKCLKCSQFEARMFALNDLCMLSQSVRENNAIVGDELLNEWLKVNKVLNAVLSGNLDMAAYVEKTNKLLAYMAPILSNSDLIYVWSLRNGRLGVSPERFQSIVSHIAAQFSLEQMVFMCDLFEKAFKTGEQRTFEKVFNICADVTHTCENDDVVKMIIYQMWDYILIAKSFHYDVSHALDIHAEMISFTKKFDYRDEFVKRSLLVLLKQKDQDRNVLPILFVVYIRNVLALGVRENAGHSSMMTRKSSAIRAENSAWGDAASDAVRRLELKDLLNDSSLFHHVVRNITNCQRIAYNKSLELQDFVIPGESSRSCFDNDDVSDPVNMDVADGYTYMQVLQFSLKLISWMFEHRVVDFSLDKIQSLWQGLVASETSTTHEKTEFFHFLTRLHKEIINHHSLLQLLSKFSQLKPDKYTVDGVRAFFEIYHRVSHGPHSLNTDNIRKHWGCVWEILENVNDAAVVDHVITKIVKEGVYGDRSSSAPRPFVKFCMNRLNQLMQEYEKTKQCFWSTDSSEYLQKVHRNLCVLAKFTAVNESLFMYVRSEPLHGTLVPGRPIRVEMYCEGYDVEQKALSITTHTNEILAHFKTRVDQRLGYYGIDNYTMHVDWGEDDDREISMRHPWKTLEQIAIVPSNEDVLYSNYGILRVRLFLRNINNLRPLQRTCFETNRNSEEELPSTLLQQQSSMYSILFNLPIEQNKKITAVRRQLFNILPNDITVDAAFQVHVKDGIDKLSSNNNQHQYVFKNVEDIKSVLSLDAPYKFLYGLEVLCGKLMPTKYCTSAADTSCNTISALRNSDVVEHIIGKIESIADNFKNYNINDDSLYLDIIEKANTILRHFLLNKFYMKEASMEDVEVFTLLESANPELPSTSKSKKGVVRQIANTFAASSPTLQNWDIDKITHFSKIWIKLISVVRSNNNHSLGNLTERGVDRFGEDCDKDVFFVEQALYATKKLSTSSQRLSFLRSKISVDCLRLMLEIFQQFVDSSPEVLYYELLSKFVFDENWRVFAKTILLDGKDSLLRHVGCFYLVSIIKKCTTGSAALCLTCLYELVLPILNDDRPSSALDSSELTQRTNILDVMQTISSILVNTTLGDDDDLELWSCAVDGILNLVLPLTKKIVSTKVDKNFESADSALVSALMETVRGLVASGNLGEKITKEVGEFIITKLVNRKLFPGYYVDADNFSGQSSISPPTRWNDFGIRKQAVSLLLELAATNHGSNAILLLEKLHMRFETELISGWEFEPDVEEKLYNRVGLKNDGGTCYMNSILQQIFAISPIAEKFVSLHIGSDFSWESGLKSDLLVELQRVFGHLYLLLEKIYVPRGVWNAFRFSGDDHLDTKKQHDAIDFLTELVDKCDTIMEKMECPLIFKPQLSGKFAYEYICYECYTRHQGPEEEYLTVNLELHGTTLEDSLQHYVDGEILEGENAYHCRECNSKRTTLRRGSFYTLPNTLSIQLKRFTFDYTGRQAQKNNEYCKFPEFLDMNPYMKHSQTYDAKDIDMLFEEIHSTQKLGSTTKSNSNTPHPSPSSPMKMRRRRRISTLPTQQVNPEDYHYELVGVLAHSGLAAAGHYFSFVKDQDSDSKKPSWYELNDAQVKPFDIENEAENTWFGGHFRAKNVNNLPEERTRTWNAYVLFYQKKPISGFGSSLVSETKSLRQNQSEVFHSMPHWLQVEIVDRNTRFIKERDLFSDEYRDLMLEAASQFFTSMCQLLPDEEVEYKENMCLLALKYILSFCSRIIWRLSSMFRCPNVLSKSQKVLRQLLSATPNVRKRFLMVLAEDNYKIFDEMSLCPNLDVFKSFFENVSDTLTSCVAKESNSYTHNKEAVFIRKSLNLLKNEYYHNWDNVEVIVEMLRRVSYHTGGIKILWELEASSYLCDLVVSHFDGDSLMKLRVSERDLRHERMRSVPELFLNVLNYGIFQNDQIDDCKLALTKISVHFFITWIYCSMNDNACLREKIVNILAEADDKLGPEFTALRINALLHWLTAQSISISGWGAVVSLVVSTVLIREKCGHEDCGRALLLFLDEQEVPSAEDSTVHSGIIPWLEHMISKGAFKVCHDMHRALEVLYNCKASAIIQIILSSRIQRLKIIGQRIDECAYDSQSLVYDQHNVSHKARDFILDGGSSTIMGISEVDSISIPTSQDLINIEQHDQAPNAFTATALVTSSSEDIDFKKIM